MELVLVGVPVRLLQSFLGSAAWARRFRGSLCRLQAAGNTTRPVIACWSSHSNPSHDRGSGGVQEVQDYRTEWHDPMPFFDYQGKFRRDKIQVPKPKL